MSDRQVQSREQIEFEELNRWQRHIDNIAWTVTSVFLTINIIAIGGIFEYWATIRWYVLLGPITSLVLIILWVLLLWFITQLTRVSLQLKNRIVDLGRNWYGFVGSFNTSVNVNLRVSTGVCQAILRTHWGKLALILAIIFIVFWLSLFLLFIGVLPSY